METTSPSPKVTRSYVVLAGNPNCGKTTLFNALTGLRAKVGNYPGVTVERKEGRLLGLAKESNLMLLDLPGTYSLSPQSLDEQISRDVLFHRLPEVPPPSLVVVVVDASNLQRNLYLATQIIELGYPTLIALNMIDVARENGQEIDPLGLSDALGVPVVPVVASSGHGVAQLKQMIAATASSQNTAPQPRHFYQLPADFEQETAKISDLVAAAFPESRFQARAEALLILSDERAIESSKGLYPETIRSAVASARQRLQQTGIDWSSAAIESR